VSDNNGDGPGLEGAQEEPGLPRRRPGFFSRLFVVAFAICLGAMATALLATATIVGVVLGLVTAAVAMAMILIAIGAAEWWAARRRAAGAP